MSLTEFAYPGLPLCPSSKHVPGPGTYIYNSQIHATIAGQPSVSSSSIATNSFTTTTTTPTKQPQKSPQPSLSTLCISRLPPSTPNSTTSNTLPRVSSIVLARVTRVTARQVNVSILVVDDQVCRDEWSGVIRVEDIRGWEKDKVVTYEGFRAGDIVRGEVVSRACSFPGRLQPLETSRYVSFSLP